MDFIAILILGSSILSAVIFLAGPYLESRGIILFEHSKSSPRTKGRTGIKLMVAGAIIFLLGLLARNWLESSAVTPVVLIGYVLWFVGGFVAVVRNEVIKACGDKAERR